MEILDFAEQQGQRAAAFSLATLDANRQRSHSLLVLLLGGAGAMGGLALGMAPGNALLTLAAFSVAVWWFALAAVLVLRGMRTQPVRSWAGQGWPLIEKSREFDAYIKEAISEGEAPKDCLTLLREMELRKAQAAADEYRVASTAAAAAMDLVLTCAAFTPVVPALVWCGWWLQRYFG